MARDLTDAQWARIAPLLPPSKARGRHRADDRRTLNGILWVLRSGARWQDLPKEYGSDTTCHRRLQEWQAQGVWERVWAAMLSASMSTPKTPPGSLAEALASIPDSRRQHGRVHDLVPLLQLAVAALLCGARSLYAIAQWGRERLEDNPALLESLGLAPGRSPCVATLHRVFKGLDVPAFETALGGWLARCGVEPEEPMSLDGKTLRGIHGEEIAGVHLVSAYAIRSGAVLAQIAAPGKGQELAAAKEVLDRVSLEDRVVAADALLTQREICKQIVAGGGNYLLPVKENQPTLQRDLAAAFSPPKGGFDGCR